MIVRRTREEPARPLLVRRYGELVHPTAPQAVAEASVETVVGVAAFPGDTRLVQDATPEWP